MRSERIYVFDGQRTGNRRVGAKVASYNLKSFLKGFQEGLGTDMYDKVKVECRKSSYDYDYPTVTAFVAVDSPRARRDFLHFCKILGHEPQGVAFVTTTLEAVLCSVHQTLEGAIERTNQRQGTFPDFYPLED